MISRYVNLASVKPNQIDAVRKHGVLTDEPDAHAIFSPLPEAMVRAGADHQKRTGTTM
jgi:hypothetical protein